MKASICVLGAALLVAPASQALSAPKTAAKPVAHHRAHVPPAPVGQTWASGHCRLTIPKSWGDYHGGKADPKDHAFNVTLGRAGDPRSMAATVKAMHGRVLSDRADMVLMQVDLRGRDAKQYWVLTKPGPGCRATVTFTDQATAARKIAESLKKAR